MKTHTTTAHPKNNFSIIFHEIEKYKAEKTQEQSGITQETLRDNEIIREFSEICRNIGIQNEQDLVFHVFA
ncbi:MAG: hypothetical protein LBF81_01780 [Prevotellaceae bacterium]|jgi:hypothetical protein|nr:hypothetical protein [Prevotellaceae bacterium]